MKQDVEQRKWDGGSNLTKYEYYDYYGIYNILNGGILVTVSEIWVETMGLETGPQLA